MVSEILTFLCTVGFLMVTSPTVRKEVLTYFDLFSSRRSKKATVEPS